MNASFDPKQVMELMQKAQDAHQRGLTDKAENLYSEILSLERDAFRSEALKGPDGAKLKTLFNTTFAQVYNNLASIRSGDGQYREAADLLRTALDYAPGSVEVLTNAARISSQQGNFDKALSFSRQALTHKPDHPQATVQFARAALETGECEEALAHLEQASSRGGKDFVFLVTWGQILLQMGKTLEAKAKFQEAHSTIPKAPLPVVLTGSACIRLGQFEEAIGNFNHALKLDPANLLAHSSLANLYVQLNRLQEAEKHFKASLKIEPNHTQTLGNYAIFLFQRGHFEEAERVAAGIVEATGVREELRVTTGVVLVKSLRHLGRIDEAAERLDNLVRLSPSAFASPAFHKERGFALEAEGKYSEAFRCFEEGNALFLKQAQASPTKGFDVTRLIRDTLDENFFTLKLSESQESPVFLIGFILGGSQTLSAMLEAFPAVKPLEDSTTLNGLRMRLLKEDEPYPGLLNLLAPGVVVDLRKHYKKLLSTNDGAEERRLNINAYPVNLLDVPLILKMFPKARLIYCYSHPFDAVLNCYFKDHPPNSLTKQFASLANAAEFYAGCLALWEKFKKELPLNFIEARREELLENPGAAMKPILDYIDPEGTFNLTARTQAEKLQQAAARQKVLFPAGRWKNYLEMLGPLPGKLGAACKKLGYPVK